MVPQVENLRYGGAAVQYRRLPTCGYEGDGVVPQVENLRYGAAGGGGQSSGLNTSPLASLG